MENTQYSNNKEVLICPIISAWIFFLIHLSLFSDKLFENVFLLFSNLYLFVVAFLLTLSIERDKYNLFFASFIMTIIYDIIISLSFLMVLIESKEKEWIIYFIYIILEWSLFVVLLAYKKKDSGKYPTK